MSRLILFAHGSRDPRWRRYFEDLAKDLGSELGEKRVGLAYMEFSPPTLEDLVGETAAMGIHRLRLLPLFMAGGAHVAKDIPEQVAEALKRFPSLEIELLPPIGEDQRVVSLLRQIARESALKES
jgi:sirohydrochlorin cobaltochelatase